MVWLAVAGVERWSEVVQRVVKRASTVYYELCSHVGMQNWVVR